MGNGTTKVFFITKNNLNIYYKVIAYVNEDVVSWEIKVIKDMSDIFQPKNVSDQNFIVLKENFISFRII